MKPIHKFQLALSAVALAALTACDPGTTLSQKPDAGGNQVVPQVSTSTLKAQVVVPFARLMNVANASAPARFAKSGREPACRRIGPKGDLPFGGSYDFTTNVCMDVDYEVKVQRGDISIAAGDQPGTLRVAVPIRFDGGAGFSGTLAQVLSLSRKNFEGAAQAWVDLRADVDENWAPKLTGKADFRWTTPAKIEVVGGVWVPVAGLIESELRSRLEAMTKELEGAIDAQTVRAEVTKVWSARSIALPPFNGVQAHLNVKPVSVGFSGLQVFADRLELALQTRAEVSVSDQPIAIGTLPLPPLQRIQNEPGRIQLALPLQLSYVPLTQALNAAVKDKTFAADTPAGRAEVTVRGVSVYASKEDLVVGLNFAADVPGRWFDVTGEVYLYGRPKVDDAGHIVSIEDLRFSRILDSNLWSALSAVFEKQVRQVIAAQARFDLGPSLDSAKAMLNQQLREVHQREGVRIDLGQPRIAVGQIVPADKALVVEALFSSDAVVRLSDDGALP